MILKHDLVSAPGSVGPRKLAVFLHGILGSGANLRTHARRFVDAFPAWQVALMDLRAHRHSLALDGQPDTLTSAANDVLETARTLALPLHALVGHSFGGKVALEAARLAPVPQVMTLDSAPGTRVDARGSETTTAVIDLLDRVTGPWNLRDDFIKAIEHSGIAGVTNGLAQWLAMNLERRDGLLYFRLSMPRIHALIDSYLTTDLWPVLDASTSTCFHLIIGSRSKVYDAADTERALKLEETSHGHLSVDFLNAGHWVHVDDSEGLSRVLANRLGPG